MSAPDVAVAAEAAPRLTVGIGASAGGLLAFREFLTHMPSDSGMAFILVQHLDPHHGSMLVDLLRPQTAMPVVEAVDGMRIAPNRVHVIPPDATLAVEGRTLRVTRPAPPREQRWPIDTFFASLGRDQRERAVCIVLAGTGSDGARGLRTVKEHGGLTLAQATEGATPMSGMPFSAAATGLVDQVMVVADMPGRLAAYATMLEAGADGQDADGAPRDVLDHLPQICVLLRAAVGHDFSGYKERPLARRIKRRMQVLQIEAADAYIERLRQDPAECETLFQELLIGVTEFFRDPVAFDALRETVLPTLLRGRARSDSVRVWVPACATGEEAYSIAILLREATIAHPVAPKLQVFATDIDPDAIAFARRGRYVAPLPGISPARCARWFVEEPPDGFRINYEIRDFCIFSVHSVLRDPPDSRVDLISCRNLFIYLGPTLQDLVIAAFHYALVAGGYLMLGSAEGVVRRGDLFEPVDKHSGLFRRRDTPRAVLPALPGSFVGAGPVRARPAPDPPPSGDLIDLAAQRVIATLTPAYVVINEARDVVRFAGPVGRYLGPSPGAASWNVFDLLQRNLRPATRAALKQAVEAGGPVSQHNLAVEIGDKLRLLTVFAAPLPLAAGGASFWVVAFRDTAAAEAVGETSGTDATADGARVRALEGELAVVKLQLQAATDELDTAQQELRADAEEYRSVSEEYQAANEELATAKEEMQSANEELQTLNAELASRNEALMRLNADLGSFLESTQIATLFLDGSLRISRFTGGVTQIFHIREMDVGRPITDIVCRLAYADLEHDVQQVLRTRAMFERELRLADGSAAFIMRIRPYHTTDPVVDGVVITFIDITERRRHEQDRAWLAAIVDDLQDAIVGHSLEGLITSWNTGAEHLFGYDRAEAIGKSLSILLPPDHADEVPGILAALQRGEKIEHFESDRVRKDGSRVDVSLTISPVRDEQGAMIAASSVARDITERGRAERHRQMLMGELNHRVKNALATIQSIAAQTMRTSRTLEEFQPVFLARLVALAKTHDLLSASEWKHADLRDLVVSEMAPYDGAAESRVTLSGPIVKLVPKQALALGLAMHELATNAAKYGALSAPAGRVAVTWDLIGGSPPRLRLLWTETGGPPVVAPERRGFGTRVIESGLANELNGEIALSFEPPGVICGIEFPVVPEGEA